MVHMIQSVSAADIPAGTAFLLDTNVLYFLHSGYPAKAGSPGAAKSAAYSRFVGQLLGGGFSLGTTAANVQELMNLMEKTEYELYCQHSGKSTVRNAPNFFSRKDFRRDAARRSALERKLKAILRQITQSYAVYDLPLRQATVERFAADLHTHLYDPMDYIIVADSAARGRVNFITDDRDFRQDPRLQVWTA